MSLTVSDQDKSIIRMLAEQYAELANSDRNRDALSRWRELNNMQAERPLLFCNLHLLWPEIDPHLPELRVTDDRLRNVECWFQRALWVSTIGDDRYFDPWFTVRAEMYQQPEGLYGVRPNRVADQTSRGWRDMPVLKRMEDLDALKATEHRVLDPDPPFARMLDDVFGDLLPVHRSRVSVHHIWNGVIGPAAGELFRLEELLLALYEAPEMVHRFMAFASEAIVSNYKQCEAAGDWSTADYWYYNTPPHCDMLPDPVANTYNAKMKDLTGFCHAQEFEAVSPAMFEEFLFAYQRPILDLFGRVSYGCCDTLDSKLGMISQLSNLGKITVGPLANPSCYPSVVGDDAVISWRPGPALLVSDTFDEQAQRKQLHEGLSALKGCQIEVHLHEPMTARSDISRVSTWARIAREEAEASVN